MSFGYHGIDLSRNPWLHRATRAPRSLRTCREPPPPQPPHPPPRCLAGRALEWSDGDSSDADPPPRACSACPACPVCAACVACLACPACAARALGRAPSPARCDSRRAIEFSVRAGPAPRSEELRISIPAECYSQSLMDSVKRYVLMKIQQNHTCPCPGGEPARPVSALESRYHRACRADPPACRADPPACRADPPACRAGPPRPRARRRLPRITLASD